ncbi:hypothetical protein PY649_34165, partial [Rhizobium mayense]|nr:hypothetical protein [Rhizobium mayense]
WLRTATRRYRRKYSNPKPLERTQNWIKLGGKVKLKYNRSATASIISNFHVRALNKAIVIIRIFLVQLSENEVP